MEGPTRIVSASRMRRIHRPAHPLQRRREMKLCGLAQWTGLLGEVREPSHSHGGIAPRRTAHGVRLSIQASSFALAPAALPARQRALLQPADWTGGEFWPFRAGLLHPIPQPPVPSLWKPEPAVRAAEFYPYEPRHSLPERSDAGGYLQYRGGLFESRE